MDSRFNSDSQLCTNAIRPTYKDGIFESRRFDVKHAPKTTNLAVSSWSTRAPHKGFNSVNQSVPCID
jgi:hypothetical protein